MLDPETGELDGSTSRSRPRCRTCRARKPVRDPRRITDRAFGDPRRRLPPSGTYETVVATAAAELDPASISEGRAIEFESPGGRTAHAFFYPPTNAEYEAPEGEKPPLGSLIHGGPTSQAKLAFSPLDPVLHLARLGGRRRQLRRVDRLRASVSRAPRTSSGASSTSRTASRPRAISLRPGRSIRALLDRRRQRGRLHDVACARAERCLAAAVFELRSHRPRDVRRDDAQVRVALHGLAPRPAARGARRLSRALTGHARGPDHGAGTDRAGSRRQGRAARAGGADRRGARSATTCRTSTSPLEGEGHGFRRRESNPAPLVCSRSSGRSSASSPPTTSSASRSWGSSDGHRGSSRETPSTSFRKARSSRS